METKKVIRKILDFFSGVLTIFGAGCILFVIILSFFTPLPTNVFIGCGIGIAVFFIGMDNHNQKANIVSCILCLIGLFILFGFK